MALSTLRSAEAVSAHVDHIVHATDDAVAAVGIALGTVAAEVVAGVAAEVGLLVALVIAPSGAHDARPRELDAEHAFHFVLRDLLAVGGKQHGLHAGQWPRRVARLFIGDTRDGRDHDAAVSVCHQVSTMGQRFLPMCSLYHCQASSLIGSPTLPITFSESSE
jgi:hypothetical protein